MADSGPPAHRVRRYGLAWWGWLLGLNLAWPLVLSALIRLGPLAETAYRTPAAITCVLLLATANQIMGRLMGGAGWVWLLTLLNLGAFVLTGKIAAVLIVPDVPAIVGAYWPAAK